MERRLRFLWRSRDVGKPKLITEFETFGIKHLSCSSLSKWQGCRGAWLASYIFKLWDEGSPAMWRGSAVEKGLEYWLLKGDLDGAIEHAARQFENDAQGECDDGKIDKERDSIKPMVEMAVKAWQDHVKDTMRASQQRTELWLDGISVPIIGYLDFALEKGYSVDLKTTHSCPSQISYNHRLQIASYAKARGEDRAGIMYVTTKKSAYFEIGASEIEASLKELHRAARGLSETLKSAQVRALLANYDPKSILARMCVPDPDSFYWSDKAYLSRVLQEIQEWS